MVPKFKKHIFKEIYNIITGDETWMYPSEFDYKRQ
jgi:hypothetical protein